uniref:F-box protein At4g35930 n=1 Tax=Anthurium amnicola TaxID=1678845 RepID=A0A1D1ZK14_9ARAE
MAFKQKRRVRNAKNRYLRPGALAQFRYSRAISKSCTDIGKKRVVLDSKKAKMDILCQTQLLVDRTPVASPDSTTLRSVVRFVDSVKPQKSPMTPKTPLTTECDSLSGLESLPMDILVKILCHLHHDQLKAVFHVSWKFRKAVLLARQYHFNYTTPDRSRQAMLNARTPLPTEHWPFMKDGNAVWGASPQTPKAPRQGPRPPRLHLMDMSQIAAVLFQESALPSRLLVPPGLPRPVCKSVASNRVLFYEDELCQAVAQNKLH